MARLIAGGQALVVTDVRLTIQHDLTETISVMVGYRRVISTYKSFDGALGTEAAETHLGRLRRASPPMVGVMIARGAVLDISNTHLRSL